MSEWTREIDAGKAPMPRKATLPSTIFAANAGSVGDLRSAILAEQIVEFYKAVQRVDHAWVRVNSPDLNRGLALDYAKLATAVFASAVPLLMKLQRLTRHRESEQEDFVTRATQQDAEDSQLSAKVLTAIDELFAKAKSRRESGKEEEESQ